MRTSKGEANSKNADAGENSTRGESSGGFCRFSSPFSSLLSSSSQHHDFLLSPTGTQVKLSDLEDRVIGLYFSANWNASCRSFTQVLTSIYQQLRNSGCEFEIVFVSSDENSVAFDDYFKCMPWLAIPFSDVERKKALNRKFDVEEMPCLVILQRSGGDEDDDHGVLALRDGAEIVYRYGVRAFPFTKERIEELRREEMELHERQTLTNLLTGNHRDFVISHSEPQQVAVASLIGQTIGLYFSAQWCLPCHNFTPKLISTYHKIKQIVTQQQHADGINGGNGFEIVFVSTDREESDFVSYFKTMPWLALPFGDPNIRNLTKHFDVRGIPCLVILGPDGKTVTKRGRNFINLYGAEAYPFTRPRLELLEKRMEEAARSLPRSEFHAGHRHELTLVSEGSGGGPFICCDCEEQGSGWAYQCLECGYEVHPKCVRAVGRDQIVG